MSAGGHHHGDPTLPRQPASCSGLLSSGSVNYWFTPVQSSLTSHDVIQHCEPNQSVKITALNLIHRQIHQFRRLIFVWVFLGGVLIVALLESQTSGKNEKAEASN